MKESKGLKIKRIIMDMLIVVISCGIGSYGIVAIMIPNGLTYGGIAGLSRLVQILFNVDYSLVYYMFSGIILVLVFVFLGINDVKKIILMSVTYPTITLLFTKMHLQFVNKSDPLLMAILLGVSFGISFGISFYGGFSSGGTDSLGKILKFKLFPHFGLSKTTTMIDLFIITAQGVLFGAKIAAYALVAMFTAMKVTDMVLYGFSSKLVRLSILTKEPEKAALYIMQEMHRGITSLSSTGEFTGITKKELIVYCTLRESIEIKRYLRELDQKSFVAVIPVKAVWGAGKGFSDINSNEEV